MPLPFDKLQVLDFTHLLPGELCSTILTDLGFKIIRIESLERGLGQRLPPVIQGESLYYWSLHRNKQRIALNLKSKPGIEIVHKLAGQSDVILENFRPGVMNRLGIGYNQLQRVNSKLIFCSISGYGQNSAWSQRPGHDLNYVAEAGILSFNQTPDGQPIMPGVLVSDYMAGIYAALAIVSALYERECTGQGKCLDISMFECALSTLNILATMLLYTGQSPQESGFAYNAQLPNYNLYKCQDGRYLAVASLEPKFWQTFCDKIGKPDLPSPTGPDQTMQNEFAQIISQKSLRQWLDIFEGSNCCVSPVHSLEEALSYLPSRERGIITHLVHPILGKVPQMATPVSAKGVDPQGKTSALNPTKETVQVLKRLGYSKQEIQVLANEGVIPAQQ